MVDEGQAKGILGTDFLTLSERGGEREGRGEERGKTLCHHLAVHSNNTDSGFGLSQRHKAQLLPYRHLGKPYKPKAISKS